MDERVESIELALREQVAATLEDDAEQIPPHVLQKADERIQAAAKKNANIELDQYERLSRRLEYCDLRELQDTILSKNLWQVLKKRFANKETLSVKFGQLQILETANATVDQSTRSREKRARRHSVVRTGSRPHMNIINKEETS